MKEIILVGNGSSMLDKKNSYEIDSYKKVVRFNSFKIKGYEDYVGTKTNIWFTVNKAHIDRIHDFDEVIFHSWASEENCDLYKDFLKYRSVEKIKKEMVKETGIEHPSTGLIAIFYFLKDTTKSILLVMIGGTKTNIIMAMKKQEELFIDLKKNLK